MHKMKDGAFTAHNCWFAIGIALVSYVSIDTSYPGHVGMCQNCA